jgi:hypothetical protein
MHAYLRAIGLSEIHSRKELDVLIGDIMTHPTNKCVHQQKLNERFVEISKDYSNGMGITLRGTYDNKGFFHLDHYFPYLKPMTISVQDKVYLNKKVDTKDYSVLCDDKNLGVALIFYLLNEIDYLNLENTSKYFVTDSNVFLSGLCKEGKILLPVMQNDDMVRRVNKRHIIKQKLITEARKGNQKAIDSLSLKDIDTHARISKRTKKEDIYTIVENSFYPSGDDNDNYSIIGNIMKIYEDINSFSKETVYRFIVECNHVMFSICINKKDLLGKPRIGDRFKGDIWLQGKVDF